MSGANAILAVQFVAASLTVALGIVYTLVVGSARGRIIRIATIPAALVFLFAVVWGKLYAREKASIGAKDILSNPAQAIDDLTQAIRIDPTSSSAYFKRGMAYLNGNYPRRAHSDLENAAALSPADREISIELARATEAIGDTANARAIIDAVLAKDPRNFDALNARGIIETAEKNYSNAARDFEAALAVSDNDEKRFIAQMNVSLPLTALKRFDEALSHLRSALELRPSDPDALAALANTYGQKALLEDSENLHREALEAADRALAINPNQTLARMTRSAALFYLGKKDTAIRELSDLIRQHPDDSELLVLRAGMYTETHQEELARKDLLESRISVSSSGVQRLQWSL